MSSLVRGACVVVSCRAPVPARVRCHQGFVEPQLQPMYRAANVRVVSFRGRAGWYFYGVDRRYLRLVRCPDQVWRGVEP